MKALLQRVLQASVEVDGKVVGAIERGLLIFLGVGKQDTPEIANQLAAKTATLRIFADEEGKQNLDVQEVGGAVLVVSQFTLYGDCRRGRRPSFDQAALPAQADRLYQLYVESLRAHGIHIQTGVFQSHMKVHLVNDGPVTFLLQTE